MESIILIVATIIVAIVVFKLLSSAGKSKLVEKVTNAVAIDLDKHVATSHVEFNELIKDAGLTKDIVSTNNELRDIL